jgi:ribose 5-phosphate isomerase A
MREEGLAVRGVPSSLRTESLALELGIPLLELAEVEDLDLTIDGADEVDGELNLIKGGGGALLREKVLAAISRREVIIIGPDKLVETLGADCPLPLEVGPFAAPVVERRVRALGFEPRLRTADGEPVLTDNGGFLLDCHGPGMRAPREMEARLLGIPGVVECGLFCGLVDEVLVGREDGSIERLARER